MNVSHLQETDESAPVAQLGRALCRVTYRMTDQMGVVYYGNYMELFEMGRVELLRAHGLAYREMEEDGFMLPVVHAACDYLSPAKYDDLLEIETRIASLSRAQVEFEYVVRRAGQDVLLATGRTRHCYLSPDGRVRRLSARWSDQLVKLKEGSKGNGTE